MPEPSGPVRVKGPQRHQRLIEHLVEKRVRCFEYLRHFHTTEDGLWMNTVRLGKTDIREYFQVNPDVLHMVSSSSSSTATSGPSVSKRNAAGEPMVHIPHMLSSEGSSPSTSTTGGPSSSSGGTTPPPLLDPQFVTSATSLKALPGIGGAVVDPNWAAEYLPKLYAIGMSLSDLLLLPAGGAAFVNAVYELFLELDVVFASGSASRAIAGRQLKNHRLAKRRDDATMMTMPPESPSAIDPPSSSSSSLKSQSTTAASVNPLSLQTSKPYLMDERFAGGGNLPSYDLLIPSLCTTCILVYRRMCDFESDSNEADAVGGGMMEEGAFSSAEVARMVLHIDRRLKKLFFGNISKELGKLARLRTVQHTRVLMDHIFGAYTQLDEGLLEELMHTAGTLASRQKAESAHRDPTTSSPATPTPSRSPEQRWQAPSHRPLDDHVFADNDDETY